MSKPLDRTAKAWAVVFAAYRTDADHVRVERTFAMGNMKLCQPNSMPKP
jgi:hypothetical protein